MDDLILDNLTFRQMEEIKGEPARKLEIDSNTRCSWLGDWYDSIEDTSLKRFSAGDIARSIRQKLYLNYLIPYAFQRLEKEPCAGDLYYGELLIALGEMPADAWQEYSQYREKLVYLIELAIETDVDDDLAPNTITNLERILGRMGA